MTVLDTQNDAPFTGEVKDAASARELGPDYVTAVGKVIASHVRNELAGANLYDEPAIAMARTPHEKWLACRIAMEEYGHHLKFAKLSTELGLPDPLETAPISVFQYELKSWTEFCALKAIIDLAEVILGEDLENSSYLPLRNLIVALAPEEKFHVSFGRARCLEIIKEEGGPEALQEAVDKLVLLALPFFGRSTSRNNELFRHWGVKKLTNDECRELYIERCRNFVVGDLGLKFPEVSASWEGEDVQQTK